MNSTRCGNWRCELALAQSPAESPQKHGFTLVELLVVIGIIALLTSLLMPALAGARRSAQQIKCAANLRSLGQSMSMCANEHRGYFPLAGSLYIQGGTVAATPSNLGDATRQRYTYFDNGGGNFLPVALPLALAPYITDQTLGGVGWAAMDAALQAQGPLQDAFLCPADEATIERTYPAPSMIYVPFTGNYLNNWSSYGFNSEVLGWCDNGVTGMSGHSRLRGHVAAVPQSSNTMLLCDGGPNFANSYEIWVLGAPLSLGDAYAGTGGTVGTGPFDLIRHRGTMNILYVDGHVDSQPILSNGATTTSGSASLTNPANSPSGALMKVSMDVGFGN